MVGMLAANKLGELDRDVYNEKKIDKNRTPKVTGIADVSFGVFKFSLIKL